MKRKNETKEVEIDADLLSDVFTRAFCAGWSAHSEYANESEIGRRQKDCLLAFKEYMRRVNHEMD